MRNRSIALALALLASLAVASVAASGGWAQVSVQNATVDPPAGQETTIDLRVLQHGKTPVSWPAITVVATDAASGAVVRAKAAAIGPEGSYVAKIVFPSAGQWTLTFQSTDLVMEGTAAMRVAPAVAAAPGAGSAAEGATTQAQAFDAAPLLGVLFVVFTLVAAGGLVLRSRAARAGTRVSART